MKHRSEITSCNYRQKITSCNYRPWFGDKGLVAQPILEKYDAVYNASLPDCLESCAEQLHQAKSRILLNMSTTPGEAFINCCVWFRLQYAERQANILGEQQQTEKNQLNCCINSRLLTNSFYNVKSEARDYDLSCNSVSPPPSIPQL
jgi:hypothetical protein